MSDYGVVATLNPPTLKNVRQDSLIEFDNEYIRYLDKVEQLNQGRSSSNRIKPASIRHCIDTSLLNTLCTIGKIDDAESMEQATDDSVKKWFKDQLSLAPEDMTERVRSALDSVKYKTNPKDPSGSALDFVVEVVSALDRNNASHIVKDKEACKGLITRMINKVNLPELKERMIEAKEYWSSDQKSDISYFQETLCTNAVQVNKSELIQARLHRKGHKRKQSDSANEKVQHPNPSKASRTTKAHNIPGQGPRSSKDTWKLPCLNKEKCNGIHRVMDCPVTSEERKKQLLDEARAKAKKKLRNTSDFSKVASTSVTIPDPDRDRFEVYLQESVKAVALGDTGSDENAIDFTVFEKVRNLAPKDAIVKLKNPIKLSCAIMTEKADTYTASKKISLSMTIILPGSKLPLRVHNVPFLVVDQHMKEVIIGRGFLKRIGFNLHDHLLHAQKIINGKQFEQLNSAEVVLASLAHKGLQYNSVDDDPIPPLDSAGAAIGSDTPHEIGNAIECITSSAIRNGLSEHGKEKMRFLLSKYKNILRIRLSADPPAKVAPLRIKIREGASPHRATQRRYAPKQRQFLIDTVRKLVSVGALYKNPQAKWASPALAVAKPGTEEFRFTVDLRVPNSSTEPIVSSMPHLESMIQSVGGSTVFAKIDMAHAYWQLPLAESSRELMSIQTPIGVHSSNRLLQGSTDAGNHFQAVTADAFSEISENLLQWMDDFMVHANSEEQLMELIECFFRICEEYGFKVNAKKTMLFAHEATFCGRVFSKNGTTFEPSKINSLTNMQKPTRANELQQFLCATNWMRNSILQYSKTIAPLHELLETVYKNIKSRTKRAASKVSLSALWGNVHDIAFGNIKKQLAHSTSLAFPKPDTEFCLFTDA